MATFNIYVASYHRWNTTKLHELLEYCTYVVRESEVEKYKSVGIENVLGVQDDLINSFVKVQNWIIENAKEDVVCVLDDDIDNFMYRLEKNEKIKDKETATRELERQGQLIYDLGIGIMGSPIRSIPYGYISEFTLSGMIGPIRIYNRSKVKGRYIEMQFFSDTDFALQEILKNRIILRPNYFVTDAKIETNKGGMNIKRTKEIQERNYKEYMKPKWGKYIDFNTRKNITKILVQR